MANAKETPAKGPMTAREGPGAGAQKSVKMVITKEAGRSISEEEAKILVKLAWNEMEGKKEFNLFRLPKLGLCIVRDGEGLIIITEKEMEKAMGNE